MFVHLLLKFGKRENLEKLLAGQMHFKTLGYFRTLEEHDGRGDSYEALAYHAQPGKFQLTIGKPGSKFYHEAKASEFASPVLMRQNASDNIHVFCATMITTEYLQEKADAQAPMMLPPRFEDFGEYVLVIRPKRFIERFEEAAKRDGFERDWGPVEYYETSTFHGPTTFFHKRKVFEWQMEARFLTPPTGKPYRNVELGSLNDIATLHKSSEVINWPVAWGDADLGDATITATPPPATPDSDNSAR